MTMATTLEQVTLDAPGPGERELVAVFRRIDAASCPHTYNFHLHTTASDGQLTPTALATQALTIGLRDFAITDHHGIQGYMAARDYLSTQGVTAMRLWPGIEITSLLLDTEVHLLGYDFNPYHPILAPYLQGVAPTGELATAPEVIHRIHQAGGIVVLAHPCRYKRPAPELIAAAVAHGLDGVESYYAYGNPRPWQPSLDMTAMVSGMAAHYNLLETCGTDTHGANILQRL